jgi:hypothetical protein
MEHVAHGEEIRNGNKISFQRFQGNVPHGQGVDGKIIVDWTIEKFVVKMENGFVWF